MKYLKFKTYLKTEGVDESSINKIIDYIKDFSLYGKRKPYTTTQEYGKQFEKQLEQLKQSNNYFNNAFVVKITSIKHFSWDNIKLKMQYFLREIEDYFRGSEYCIWFNAKTDIDYEVYICFRDSSQMGIIFQTSGTALQRRKNRRCAESRFNVDNS